MWKAGFRWFIRLCHINETCFEEEAFKDTQRLSFRAARTDVLETRDHQLEDGRYMLRYQGQG